MEVKTQTRYIRVTPQKVRRVVNEARDEAALEIVDILRSTPQAVAVDVRKMLLSVVTNAKVKAEQVGETFSETELEVLEAYVDEGPAMKWFRPYAQRRAGHILKRTGHIIIVAGTREGKRGGDR